MTTICHWLAYDAPQAILASRDNGGRPMCRCRP